MDSKIGKVGKLESYRIDEEMRSQSEERCLARRNREKHAMLAEVEEKEQDVICFDDITGKELPWHPVRRACELELKCLRHLGVHEKIDENEAVAQYENHSSGHEMGLIQTKAFEGEPMQIRSRIVARDFKSDDRPDLYAGTPPLEALKAIISIAANHEENLLNHADRRVTCILRCEGSETSADAIASGGQNRCPHWEDWSDEKEHVWLKGRSQKL